MPKIIPTNQRQKLIYEIGPQAQLRVARDDSAVVKDSSKMVTQADIDNLNAAIAEGTRQVTIGGQSITYQTTASLIQARDDMVKQLRGQGDPTARRSRALQAIHGGRGFTAPGDWF